MDIIKTIWKFFINTVIISILIGFLIGQYTASQGNIEIGNWINNQIEKLKDKNDFRKN